MRCIDRDDWRGVGEVVAAEAADRRFRRLGLTGTRYLVEEEGCDAVILACTEFPLLMNDSNSPLPTLDSTRLLARAALRRAVAD